MNTTLANEIKARVLAEPERVNMKNWKETRRLWGIFQCGTVCCIAGHAVELSGGTPVVHKEIMQRLGAYLLGISDVEAIALFYFHLHNHPSTIPYHDLGLKLTMFKPGSIGYARVVAEAIDRCIERNQGHFEASAKDVEIARKMGVCV